MKVSSATSVRGTAADQATGQSSARLTPTLTGGDSFALSYAATAFVLALVATGLAHLLAVTTPRPRSFFRWIVGLATLAAVALPFALTGSPASKIGTAVINLAIGVAIGSLLTAVLARTVTDPDRSWQRP